MRRAFITIFGKTTDSQWQTFKISIGFGYKLKMNNLCNGWKMHGNNKKTKKQSRVSKKTIITEIACHIPLKHAVNIGYNYDNLMKLYRTAVKLNNQISWSCCVSHAFCKIQGIFTSCSSLLLQSLYTFYIHLTLPYHITDLLTFASNLSFCIFKVW